MNVQHEIFHATIVHDFLFWIQIVSSSYVRTLLLRPFSLEFIGRHRTITFTVSAMVEGLVRTVLLPKVIWRREAPCLQQETIGSNKIVLKMLP